MMNLYSNPEYPGIIKSMKAELKETDHHRPEIQAIIDKHWNLD